VPPEVKAATELPLAPPGFVRRGALALLAAAVVLALLEQFTNLDLALADRSFDAALRQFPWRDSWFAEVLMHRWLKLALTLLAVGLLLASLSERLWRLPRLRPGDRWRMRASAALALCIPLTISVAKQLSASHCPWDLTRYGGEAAYLRLFDAVPAGFQAGGCFPAGHASSALWLAGLCLWWLPRRPRMAALVFAAGLGAGFIVGWVQQMRGAHFLSHTLWSMWIAAAWVWAVLLAFVLAQRSRAAALALPVPNTTRA
jgi:membrane-associated PAP2 superfamily phosphatase